MLEQESNLRNPWVLRFFRWFCRPDYVDDIEGDLREMYSAFQERHPARKAQWLLVLEVFRLFRPDIVKKPYQSQKLNNTAMFKNYLKISFRNIKRHQTFSAINIGGLGVGLACCFLIAIYVQHELSYDKYHVNYDRTYRILQTFRDNAAAESNPVPAPSDYQVWGNAPVGPALAEDFPEIDQFCRFKNTGSYLLDVDGKRFQEMSVWYADSTALDIFSWPLLAGDPKTVLREPNTIVLTKSLARKYFGDENPIGRVMTIDNDRPIKVTGILADIPDNSHLKFEALMPMVTQHSRRPNEFDAWGYVDYYTYFTLKAGTDINGLTAKAPETIKKYLGEWAGYQVAFEPMRDAYLASEAKRQPGAVGSLSNIYIFTSIAFFILLIACINFMNLSTARAVERAKEVGIRKAIGSRRKALVSQFITESLLMTFLGALLAIGVASFALPYLELLSGKTFDISWIFSPEIFIIFILGILSVGLLAGSYPAWVLSGFRPVQVLKGSFKTSGHGTILRKVLVVVQFTLSIVLLIGTLVVGAQLSFLRNYDKGYQSEKMLILNFDWDGKVQDNIKFVKQTFLDHPDVTSISASRAVPGEFFPNAHTEIENPAGEMTPKGPAIYAVDQDFVPNFKMEIVAGRNYSKDFPRDSMASLILNEAAVKLWGYANPEDIIGKNFSQWGREGKVIGVIKDFNYVSLHTTVEPLSLRYAKPGNTAKLAMRISSNDLGRSLQELEAVWEELAPHRPFLAHFIDDAFNEQYIEDERFGSVFSIFSGLAIFIACLGLFGLTIYNVTQRAKEIGIRKVLGASVTRIVSIMSMDFLKLYVLALVIAVPSGIWLMSQWLDDFAYSINLHWYLIAQACFVTLLVAALTVSIKTLRAARANPVDSLRNE